MVEVTKIVVCPWCGDEIESEGEGKLVEQFVCGMCGSGHDTEGEAQECCDGESNGSTKEVEAPIE